MVNNHVLHAQPELLVMLLVICLVLDAQPVPVVGILIQSCMSRGVLLVQQYVNNVLLGRFRLFQAGLRNVSLVAQAHIHQLQVRQVVSFVQKEVLPIQLVRQCVMLAIFLKQIIMIEPFAW